MLPAALAITLLIARTSWEDRLLQAGCPPMPTMRTGRVIGSRPDFGDQRACQERRVPSLVVALRLANEGRQPMRVEIEY
jgi:hypothetical protein